MIDPPHVTQTAEQLTACIHLVIPRAEIGKVMGPGLMEVHKALADQNIAATGPWLSHHLRMTPETFDFEICVPVTTPITPVGRVKPGRLPAARVATTVYRGGFEGLGDGWGELMTWIKANGHTPDEELWEIYAAGPESSPDPASWRTELYRPLKA